MMPDASIQFVLLKFSFSLLISVISSSAAEVLTEIHQVRVFSEMAISQEGAYILTCSCMENYGISFIYLNMSEASLCFLEGTSFLRSF